MANYCMQFSEFANILHVLSGKLHVYVINPILI